MIEVKAIHKRYRKNRVLNGLSFRAQPGQITLLVGPNGAGKTTTLRILSGLARADRGEAIVGGICVRARRLEAQAQISFLPQRPDFHPNLSTARLLTFYARLRGVGNDRVQEVVELTGLNSVWHHASGTLSGGMRQRLGLALLFLPDTPFLILDEPGLSLDPEWRDQLKELLIGEARRGKTVLVATHLLGEWEGNVHRCLLCRNGQIERELDPNALQSAFRDVSREESANKPASDALPQTRQGVSAPCTPRAEP